MWRILCERCDGSSKKKEVLYSGAMGKYHVAE